MSARLADGEVFDSAKLKNTVRFLIENDMRNVVIDLGNLEYLYSDTINAFIASNRHMLEVSGRIAILTEHPKVQDILKRAGLDNIMRIYRSEAEMIADSKEILRQTSSYRIEELQKISNQPEVPSTPKTEFDEFKAEMGQRLGNKLDNNELPQYQLGVAQNAPAAPAYQAPAAPAETAYPAFNPPGFAGQQMGEAPPPGFPQNQPAPAFNYNNNGPAFGMGNATQGFPPQTAPQGFGQPQANFDFPTVQLPVGQFGNLSQAPAAPAGGNHNSAPPPSSPSTFEQDADLADPRQRKPSQERMRSPNARKQQGRRVGGREFGGQDDENTQAYAEDRQPEQPRDEKFAGYGNLPPAQPNSLTDEARGPAKLIMLVIFLAIVGVGLWYMYGRTKEEPVVTDIETPSVPTPAPVTEPAVTPAPTAVEPVPTAPTAVQPPATVTPPTTAPSATPTPAPTVTPPVAETPKPTVAETPKPAPVAPTPKPKPPKLAAVPKPAPKPPRERPAPAPEPKEENATPAPKPGMLHITSEPSGAEVLVNFSKKGSTPLDVSLSNNSNKIIVRMAGYKRFETTLPKNSPERELQVDLEQEAGTEVAPPKPKPEPKPEPEVRKPEPKAEPKEEYVEPEDLPMPKARNRDPEPEPEPKPRAAAQSAPTPGDGPIGIIFLSSSPARADILIDGKNTGKKTPAKLELPSGQHRIEMSKSGQKASVDQQVNEGKNKALHLTLQ